MPGSTRNINSIHSLVKGKQNNNNWTSQQSPQENKKLFTESVVDDNTYDATKQNPSRPQTTIVCKAEARFNSIKQRSSKLPPTKHQGSERFSTHIMIASPSKQSFNSELRDSLIIQSASPLKKKAYSIKIDSQIKDMELILSPQDITQLYTAKCNDLGIKLIDNQYFKFKEHCELYCVNRKLSLVDHNLGLRSTKVLAKIIISSLMTGGFAKVLLAKNHIGDQGAIIISEVISSTNTIVQLDMSSNNIGPEGGQAIIKSLLENESVIELNLQSHEGLQRNTLGPVGVKPLGQVLATNQFLMFLNLSGNFIGDAGVKSICDGLDQNKSLNTLNLGLNDISHIGLSLLNAALQESVVKVLNLSRNPIKNKVIIQSQLTQGAQVIEQMFNDTDGQGIEDLNLAECGITHKGALHIFRSLKRARYIRNLKLDGNNLMANYLPDLTQGIQNNTSLRELSLQNCQLGDIGCSYLMNGLNYNTTLLELNLRNNLLRAQSAQRISEVIGLSSLKLHTLILSDNYLGDQGGNLIAKALIYNKRLTKVDMFNTCLNDQCAKEMVNTLSQNSSLQNLNIGFNRCTIRNMNQVEKLILKNVETNRKNVLPRQIQQIIGLNLKATCREVIEEHMKQLETQKSQQMELFQKADRKSELLQKNIQSARGKMMEESSKVEEKLRITILEEEKFNDIFTKKHQEMEKLEKAEERKYILMSKACDLLQETVKYEKEDFNLQRYRLNEERNVHQATLDEINKTLRPMMVIYNVMMREKIKLQAQKESRDSTAYDILNNSYQSSFDSRQINRQGPVKEKNHDLKSIKEETKKKKK